MLGQFQDEDERRCARGEWCRSYELAADGDRQIRVGCLTPRNFCEADRADISRSLRQMPGQYLHLTHELARTGGSGHSIRVPFGPRVPLRVDVDALMRLFTESLYCWHERVADSANLTFADSAAPDLPEDADVQFPLVPWSRRRRALPAVKRACDVLDSHLSTLLALQPVSVIRCCDLRHLDGLPDDTDGIVHSAFAELTLEMGGAGAGLEILHLYHLARAILGETRAKPEELEGVPCRADGCGQRALVLAEPPADEHDPGNWSECLVCGDTMTEPEYRDWVALCAAYERNQRRIPATLDELPSVDVLIATMDSARNLQ